MCQLLYAFKYTYKDTLIVDDKFGNKPREPFIKYDDNWLISHGLFCN